MDILMDKLQTYRTVINLNQQTFRLCSAAQVIDIWII